jgi:hypothetical protein
MADPVQMASKLVYIGAALIANPPIVGGTTLDPASFNGDIAYVFTQPAQPCDDARCEQRIFRIDKNLESCWIYDDVSLENVEQVPGFYFRPDSTDHKLEVRSLGNVNGLVFAFRARVSSRCNPTG